MALANDLLQNVNKIQDLFTKAGLDSIKLPRTVIVGSQVCITVFVGTHSLALLYTANPSVDHSHTSN